jgi:hypothetical protein
MAPNIEKQDIFKKLFEELDILSGIVGWFLNLTWLLLKITFQLF